MYYKPDWDKAKERIKAFWDNDILDRCCIAVLAPRKNSKLKPFPELQNGPWLGGLEKYADADTKSIEKWWRDPEENYKRMIIWFENTYFGGEAVPSTYVDWGASALASFFGSKPIFKKTDVWYPQVINDWNSWKWDFNQEENEYWKSILAITEYSIEQKYGDYFVGIPEFGPASDVLSLMRGMDKLLIDLIEFPDKIKEAVNILSKTWIDLHEKIYITTAGINDGGSILSWMNLWAPGRHDQLACDLSLTISSDMFKEFFIPEIEREGNWCNYSTYHLDGPTAMKNHLDVLLEVNQIDNIEYTPGFGLPNTSNAAYFPAYKKIQRKGKKLFLLVHPEEIKTILTELSPRGLFLHTHANSEEEANYLIKKVQKWSAKKNVF